MRSKPLYKISGEISAPPSKSVMIRALAGSLFVQGETIIRNPSYCNDALAAIDILKQFACVIDEQDDKIIIRTGNITPPKIINAKESALTLHLFTFIRSYFDSEFKVVGEKTILNREFNQLVNVIKLLGKNVETNSGKLPFKISGKVTNTNIEYDFVSGSQALSGLLFLYAMLENGELKTNYVASKKYVDLTLDLLSKYGVVFRKEKYKNFIFHSKQKENNEIQIEGDWSGAAFHLVSAAISGELKVNGLSADSNQADIKILEALRQYGAEISATNESVKVSSSEHKAFQIDATDCPDLFPPLLVLAMSAEGKSVISGVHRLINKESNRAAVLVKEFSKLGAIVYIDNDDMIIKSTLLHSGIIDSHGDHRIAMAAKTVEMITDGIIEIIDPECISKSYPNFYQDIEKIRTKL